MISETQMDELADKLSGQDLELGIKAVIITIETAMRQCHSQIDILQRFIAILQHRENGTLRQENEALRKRVLQLEEGSRKANE
jgi:cell division protein FtsB